MPPVQAKICGVTTPEAIAAALAGGASHLGFVFVPKSPRFIAPADAAGLIGALPKHVKAVGLIVDQSDDDVAALVDLIPPLDVLQFHGAETPAQIARWKASGREVWKAVPIRTAADMAQGRAFAGAADRLLYDAKPPKGTDLPGGTGQRFDWTILQSARHPLPWILAGGLDSSNVVEAHRVTGARFFDVSSGVETAPGIKDVDKIAAFLKATRSL